MSEQRRKLEVEMEKLANDGISCIVEGDHVVCSGESMKTTEETANKISVPIRRFSAEDVKKRFGSPSGEEEPES